MVALGVMNAIVPRLSKYLRYWWKEVEFSSTRIPFDRVYQRLLSNLDNHKNTTVLLRCIAAIFHLVWLPLKFHSAFAPMRCVCQSRYWNIAGIHLFGNHKQYTQHSAWWSPNADFTLWNAVAMYHHRVVSNDLLDATMSTILDCILL